VSYSLVYPNPSAQWIVDAYRVFVHRYRDADAGIRADCVHEMGVWLKRHPANFLEGNYLRYVGWVLSDTVSPIYRCSC
jgi:hypothetical protein